MVTASSTPPAVQWVFYHMARWEWPACWIARQHKPWATFHSNPFAEQQMAVFEPKLEQQLLKEAVLGIPQKHMVAQHSPTFNFSSWQPSPVAILLFC